VKLEFVEVNVIMGDFLVIIKESIYMRERSKAAEAMKSAWKKLKEYYTLKGSNEFEYSGKIDNLGVDSDTNPNMIKFTLTGGPNNVKDACGTIVGLLIKDDKNVKLGDFVDKKLLSIDLIQLPIQSGIPIYSIVNGKGSVRVVENS